MDEDNKKFFEALADQKLSSDDDDLPSANLAKAEAVISHPKIIHSKEMRRKETDDDSGPEGQLTLDVYQTPDNIVVESAIAGVKPEDLDVDVTTDSITIKGSRHRERNIKDEDYFYRECYWGKFSRSVILPQEIDPDNASVSFKNGVLVVTMPKLRRQRSKKLKVKVE